VKIEIENLQVSVRGLPAPVTIYHITDSHLCLWDDRDHPALQEFARTRDQMFSNGHPGMLEECFREMLRIAQDGDAIILTGDIIDFPGAANVDALAECLQENHVPLLYTYGNHDHDTYIFGPAHESARQANLARLKEILPTDPVYDHLDVGGVRFVGLDDTAYQISAEQTEKLRVDLACGMPVVLCMHIPLYAHGLYEPTCNFWRSPLLTGLPPHAVPDQTAYPLQPTPDTQAAVSLLQEAPALAAVLAGHVHFSHDDDLYPGVRQYVGANGAMRYMRKIQFVPAEA